MNFILGMLAAAVLYISAGEASAQSPCPKGHALRVLEQEYEENRRLAEMYQQAGLGSQYGEQRRKLQRIIDRFPIAHLEQEIENFWLTRRGECLAAAFSKIVGLQVEFLSSPGGKWDVFVSGSKTREGLTDEELLTLVKRSKK